MKIPLEDLFEDIVGKAQRGLQVSDHDLCRRAQLSVEEFRSLIKESGNPEVIPGVANALNLGPKALADSYARSWYPSGVPETEGAKQFNSPLIDMTVNAYLVWNPETKDAAIFDTGSDASELLSFVASARLTRAVTGDKDCARRRSVAPRETSHRSTSHKWAFSRRHLLYRARTAKFGRSGWGLAVRGIDGWRPE
jgi:hypothetical protein